MAPSISVLIPTAGRLDLRRALAAVVPQLKTGDEVIVIGDVVDVALPITENIVAEFGPLARYIEHDAGHHCWGHCALNFGLTQARGSWIHCSDDDDVHTPGS